MKEPTPLEMDYYPRLKIGHRWFLIVPETGDTNPHTMCHFHCPGVGHDCKLMNACGHDTHPSDSPTFRRLDCGNDGTIFIRPSKWPEYRALLVAKKLEGQT